MSTNAPSYAEQVAQFAVEETPGVPQEPEHRFVRSALTIKPVTTTDKHSAPGSYYTTSTWLTSDESEGALTGVPDFNEIRPQLNLSFGLPVEEDVTFGTGETAVTYKKRTYQLKPERPKWTVVFGTAEAAAQASFMFAKSFSLDFGINSKTAKVDVGLGGGKFTDGATLSATATAFPESLITALKMKVTQATTFADLATSTTSTKAVSSTMKWDGLARSENYMDGVDNISATVNTRGANTIELLAPKDAQGLTWLTAVRSGETRYLRHLLTGEHIAGSGVSEVRESLDIRTPVKASEHDRPEQDGAFYVKPVVEMCEDVDGNVPTLVLITKD